MGRGGGKEIVKTLLFPAFEGGIQRGEFPVEERGDN